MADGGWGGLGGAGSVGALLPALDRQPSFDRPVRVRDPDPHNQGVVHLCRIMHSAVVVGAWQVAGDRLG
jgi:hypothetical protein